MQVYGDDVTFPSAVVSLLYALFYLYDIQKKLETCAIEWSILRVLGLYESGDTRSERRWVYGELLPLGLLSRNSASAVSRWMTTPCPN
jgi:hypothetical protein